MRTPSDEELILHYYGEAADPAAVAEALAASPAVRARFEAIREFLDGMREPPVPERDERYGAAVWSRLEPRLAAPAARHRWLAFRPGPTLALAATLALAVVGAFLVGRVTAPTPPAPEPPALAGFSAASRERILLAAVAHHLERTGRLLTELKNGAGALTVESGGGAMGRAEELLDANRLYRQAAREAGEGWLVPLLAELEPFLAEAAHAPVTAAADSAQLGQRLAASDVLFKVRVVEARLRRLQRSAAAAASPNDEA
jgi:hypothetical protein